MARRERVALAAVVLLVGGLSLPPVAYLLWRTVWVDGSLTLASFRRAYGVIGLGTMAGNSVMLAVGATVLAVGMGSFLAFVLVRTDVPCRGALFVATLVPLVIPNMLHTVAWIFLAAPRTGAVNRLLEPLFGPGTLDVFSLGGMIFVEGVGLTPLIVLLMAAAFRSMDPALEESALVSGVRLSSMVRRVTVPVVRPALLAGAFLVMVRTLQTFETPAIIGLPGGVWVFTSRLWRTLNRFPPDFAQAGAYSLSLLVLTGIGVFAYSRFTSRGRSYQVVTGKGISPRPLHLGRWRWPATALVGAYVLVAVVLPLLILAYASTQRFYAPPSLDRLAHMSWSNYSATLHDGNTWRAARNSIVLAVATASFVMFVTAVASWLLVRTRLRGRWILDGVATLPIALPGLVIGLALLITFLRSPIPLYGTLWILLVAYVIRGVPYGIRFASTGMHQVSAELEEAAVMGGATWWYTFRRVLLPLVRPAIVAGWLYVVLVSLRELSASLLLYSPGGEVLSVRLWQRYQDGAITELAALGLLMTVGLSGLAVLAYRVGIVGDVAGR